MPNWFDLIVEGNIAAIIISFILVALTGAVGASIVNGIYASRRGVRGDALVKEQNGITGLGKLADSQGEYIDRLEKRLSEVETSAKEQIAELRTEFEAKVDELETKLFIEVEYSNVLISALSENTIPIPPRPIRRIKDK